MGGSHWVKHRVHTRFLFRPPRRVLPKVIKKKAYKGGGGGVTSSPRPLGYMYLGLSREMGRTTLQEKEGKGGGGGRRLN